MKKTNKQHFLQRHDETKIERKFHSNLDSLVHEFRPNQEKSAGSSKEVQILNKTFVAPQIDTFAAL